MFHLILLFFEWSMHHISYLILLRVYYKNNGVYKNRIFRSIFFKWLLFMFFKIYTEIMGTHNKGRIELILEYKNYNHKN